MAQEIVRATQSGVHDWLNGATVRDCVDVPAVLVEQIEARHRRLPAAFQQRRPVPVSVKTRIGYATSQVPEWIPQLLESEPAAISIHGRTLTQGYSGESNWDEIGCAAEIARGSGTLILGNGDILSLDDAYRRINGYGVDGALIGRASYGNPYVFRHEGNPVQRAEPPRGFPRPEGSRTAIGRGPTPSQDHDKYDILHIALEHARLYEESFAHLNGYKFLPMRKHLGWYVRHLPGASHLRRTLTQTSSLGESVATIEHYLAYRQGWDN